MSKSNNPKTLTATDVELGQDAAQRSPSRRSTSGRRLSVKFTQPSQTQQQFKSAVDPNQIIRHYAETGIDPYASRVNSKRYGDATAKEYTQAMFLAAAVQSEFHDLPASERAYYENDPAQWLADQSAPIEPPEAPEAPEPPLAVEDGPTDPD